METLKKHLVRIVLGFLLTLLLLGHAARLYQIPFISQLDAIIYDTRLRLTMPQTVDDRIVILDIDEKSLKEEGRWPWSRNRLALLIDKLFDKYGVAVAGFDIVFAEKDQSSGLKILQEIGGKQLQDDARFQTVLEKIRPQLEYDRLFAESIRNRPVILSYYFSTSAEVGEAAVGVLPQPVLPAGTFAGRGIPFEKGYGYGGNLPELMQAAAGAGHFNPIPDFDGVSRRVPLLMEFKGAYYESLSLAIVRALFGFPKVVPGTPDTSTSKDYSGLEWLELSGENFSLKIPVDPSVSALVPYRGGRGSFKYISIADVLHDRVNPEDLKGKLFWWVLPRPVFSICVQRQ